MDDEQTCDLLDLGCHLSTFATMLADFFRWLLLQLVTFANFLLSAIPVPSFIQDATFQLPDGVLWFASVLQLEAGAAIMVTAWTVRFIIRRLPFVG